MTDLAEQVADTLEAAADYIETNGWYQGDALGPPTRTDRPSVCLVGALTTACIEIDQVGGLYAAAKVLGTEVRTCIVRWNDAFGREEWEVTDLLRSTAKKVRHGDLELS